MSALAIPALFAVALFGATLTLLDAWIRGRNAYLTILKRMEP